LEDRSESEEVWEEATFGGGCHQVSLVENG